ncbi:hypothetical protein GYB22_12505, partial [bacterium]|nr:hypothetical protein [bacterium]
MKKLSLLLLIGSIAFVGCDDTKKDDPKGDTTTPTSYTQKSILEYFSGAWCGFCPDGRLVENSIRDAVGSNQFMAVVYHAGNPQTAPDNMDAVYDDQIYAKFNGAGYPTGMINRIN